MRIALDPDVGKLDPLVIGDAHLLEVLDKAVVVRSMRTSLACNHDIRHSAEVGELVDFACLQYTRALGWVVRSDLGSGDDRAVGHWRVVLQWSVSETTGPRSGAANPGCGSVPDQRGERDVAWLDVDVGTQQVWTCVGPDGCVGTAGRVADCV